jgi:hypothetical protein
MMWVMAPSGSGPCCFILWSLPSEYNIIQRAIISDDIVWPLPDMLELDVRCARSRYLELPPIKPESAKGYLESSKISRSEVYRLKCVDLS